MYFDKFLAPQRIGLCHKMTLCLFHSGYLPIPAARSSLGTPPWALGNVSVSKTKESKGNCLNTLDHRCYSSSYSTVSLQKFVKLHFKCLWLWQFVLPTDVVTEQTCSSTLQRSHLCWDYNSLMGLRKVVNLQVFFLLSSCKNG